MLQIRHSHAILLPLLFLVGSCASTDNSGESAAPVMATASDEVPEEKKVDEEKVSDCEHKLKIAQAKLEVNKLEFEAFERNLAIQVAHAQEDVAMAKANLENFMKVKMPNRKAQAELSMQGAKDSVIEAAEELEQLQIMYKDQDLHDMTAEFVISRGKRRADRAAARIQIQEKEHTSLMEHELPMEQHKLEISVRKSEESAAKVELDGELARLGKQIKLSEAENSVERAERELTKARDGGEK